MSGFGRKWLFALLLVFLCPLNALAQQAVVQLTPQVKDRYPNLQRVLNGILQTVEDPSLFPPDVWNQKIHFTGKVTNVLFSDVMKEYRTYLTDGRLQIDLRPDPDARKLRARVAAQVVDEEHMLLFYMAGSRMKNGKAYYSDYQLAQTIFHELMHVYQLRTGNVGFDKEAPAYYMEGTLPIKHFDRTLYPDNLDENSPVAGPTPTPLPVQVEAIVNPVLFLEPGKPGTSYLKGTPVKGSLQFSLQGLPPGEQRTMQLTAVLRGPDGFSLPISCSISARGSDYQDDELSIELPLSAPAGTYRCQGSVSVDKVRAPVAASFSIAYPELTMSFSGPTRQKTGLPVAANLLLQGTPPFAWEWTSSSGEKGTGSSPAFSMNVAKMPADTLLFTVRATDARSVKPLVKTFVVDAALPTLQVTIGGPNEVCVGRTVFLTAKAQGGAGGAVSYQWSLPDSSQRSDLASFVPTGPGQFQVSVRAIEDQKLYSAPAVHTLTVYPALEASIAAPASASPGEEITLSAVPRGGKPPYKYLWTNPLGEHASKQVVRLQVDGKVGEAKLVSLKVRDSLEPPQEVEVGHTIQVQSGPQIKTGPLRLTPAKIEPGKVVKLEIEFDLVNFPPGVHQVTVHFWLEGAEGTGKGARSTQQHSYAGQRLKVSQNFGVDKRTSPGTLRAQVKILAGDQQVLRQSSMVVVRPGGLQDVTVNSRALRLKIWDHGSEDGDIVSIYLNGNKVAGPGKITKNGAVVGLQLRAGSNELIVYAHNEGKVSPNTASIELTNVVQGPSSQRYSLKKGEKGRFFIVAP